MAAGSRATLRRLAIVAIVALVILQLLPALFRSACPDPQAVLEARGFRVLPPTSRALAGNSALRPANGQSDDQGGDDDTGNGHNARVDGENSLDEAMEALLPSTRIACHGLTPASAETLPIRTPCTANVTTRLVAPLTALLTERDGSPGLLFFVEVHKLVLRGTVPVKLEACGFSPPGLAPTDAPLAVRWRNHYERRPKDALRWQRLRAHHWHETSRRARGLPGLFAKVRKCDCLRVM